MTEVIDLTVQGSSNLVVQDALKNVKLGLLQGQPLSSPMRNSRVFLRPLVQMVAVGEETGRLESTLATVSQAYEIEADERTTAMISFIEPAMTLFIALVVGFMAMAVVMPMYSIIGALS